MDVVWIGEGDAQPTGQIGHLLRGRHCLLLLEERFLLLGVHPIHHLWHDVPVVTSGM